MRRFWFQVWEIYVLHEFLHFDKFKVADFKYDNSFSNFNPKYSNKILLIPILFIHLFIHSFFYFAQISIFFILRETLQLGWFVSVYINADLENCPYLCLHMKIICSRFQVKAHSTFWHMWNVCLQTFRNNRIPYKLAYFLRNLQTSQTFNLKILRTKNVKFSGYWFYMNTNR